VSNALFKGLDMLFKTWMNRSPTGCLAVLGILDLGPCFSTDPKTLHTFLALIILAIPFCSFVCMFIYSYQ
jgi:hypothetical protein